MVAVHCFNPAKSVASFQWLFAHSSTGWVQLKLAEKANLEIANSKPSSDLTEGKGNQSRVGAAIERLEGSLKK